MSTDYTVRVCIWCASGVQLMCSWCASDASDVHLVYIKCASDALHVHISIHVRRKQSTTGSWSWVEKMLLIKKHWRICTLSQVDQVEALQRWKDSSKKHTQMLRASFEPTSVLSVMLLLARNQFEVSHSWSQRARATSAKSSLTNERYERLYCLYWLDNAAGCVGFVKHLTFHHYSSDDFQGEEVKLHLQKGSPMTDTYNQFSVLFVHTYITYIFVVECFKF